MSSNRARLVIRLFAVAGLTAALAACASRGPADPHVAQTPLTPTQRFAPVITETADQVLLAPHATGLSVAQTAAVDALVQRWQDAGGGPILIHPPAGGGGEIYRMTSAVQARLEARGVQEAQIRIEQGDEGTGGAVMVAFSRYAADGPRCGRNWTSYTHSSDNAVNSNFGCATTANLAAMIANPADLAAPRPMDPADAGRRENVIGKYRAGSVTSTSSDSQATGHVSTAVN
jgi:pilus assembly protein CpaD